jgi:hypothetical protein
MTDHIKKAQEMGLFLRPLVKFLPYETLSSAGIKSTDLRLWIFTTSGPEG